MKLVPLTLSNSAATKKFVKIPVILTLYAGIGAFAFSGNPNNKRNLKVILQDYLDEFSKTD